MKFKYLNLLLMVLLLSSCKHDNFAKIDFPYAENGQIITVNGEKLYDLTINETASLACIFTIDNCATCHDAVSQLEVLCKIEHFNIYQINLTTITQEDYQYIVDATSYANDAYKFPEYGEALSLPIMYIFAYQGVIITFQEYFVDNILKYVNMN